MRTLDIFFHHVHHVPVFSFLHRASLMQRYHSGLVDRALLLALVGVTTLLVDRGPGMAAYGGRCIREAETLVLRDLASPSTLRLQALVLVIKHHILSRRFPSAFVLYSIASRFASALRLNHENPKLCFLAQESRRRLMWALYMMDTGIAGGHVDLSLWAYREDAIHIQLPCNERNFEYDLPEITEPLQPQPGPNGRPPPLPDDIGFLALHIRVHRIRSHILLRTRRLISSATTADLVALPTRCAEHAAELEAFAARLPASFSWSESNARLRTYSPRLCVFFMTHVWWEQCHCELYRIALVGLPEALPKAAIEQLGIFHPSFVRHCRQQALAHARAMADIFNLLPTLDNGIPVTDMDLPVCSYQCARTLYYVFLASSGDCGMTAESATELAGVCLQMLKLSVATPATLSIVSRQRHPLCRGPRANPPNSEPISKN